MKPLRGAPVEGWILAGGQSRRMGQDKAGLMLEGRPLLEHMLAKMRALHLPARIAGLRDPLAGIVYQAIADEYPGCGPLSGLETAFAHSSEPFVLALAIDLPLLPIGFLRWLQERAIATEAIATIPFLGGEAQPLCAVYHRDLLEEIRVALRHGDYKLMRAIERGAQTMGARIDRFDVETMVATGAWSSSDPVQWQFLNCNTPADIVLVERRLANCHQHDAGKL